MTKKRCMHEWWHALGVTRHLVCVRCGIGRHYIDLNDYPGHYTTYAVSRVKCREMHECVTEQCSLR